MYHFNLLTESSLYLLEPGPQPGHIVNVSRLRQVDRRSNFRGFSIRFVLDGAERYTVNGRSYRLLAGEYLLANPGCTGRGTLDSPTEVRGICIDLLPELLDEVLAGPEPGAKGLLESDPFEHRFAAGAGRVGKFLTRFAACLDGRLAEPPALDSSFFFALAEAYVADYQPLSTQLRAIPAVKTGTRQDLLRRLWQGRDYLHDKLAAPVGIAEAARAAGLSEYHFFRLFRQAFGMSPHRYLQQKRLENGRKLLQTGHYSVSEAALQTGFADIHSFSRAFKKQFGQPPSAWKFQEEWLEK